MADSMSPLIEWLLSHFGARAALTRRAVTTLGAALDAAPSTVLGDWRTWFGHWAGSSAGGVAQPLVRWAARYDAPLKAGQEDRLLLVLQTYYAIVVRAAVDRCLNGRRVERLTEGPFAWPRAFSTRALRSLTDQIADAWRDAPAVANEVGRDWFKPLYQAIFPKTIRHALGEYYTPDWLADHVLDQVGYAGRMDQRLLDPACGSGTFLLRALRRIAANEADLSRIFSPRPPISGIDLNPLAVLSARANLWMALADRLPDGPIETPIYLGDSILGTSPDPNGSAAISASYDFVVGNPPWIAWDHLPAADRRATKPLWERLGLFSLSGKDARHGGGKKDLSMLMLYAVADRCLNRGGRLGMVVTQTLFQTTGAGDGFRRFRIGDAGPPLRVLRVDDLTDLRPFDAANWTATIALEKGAATEYPVPYVKWERGPAAESPALPYSSRVSRPLLARPANPNRPSSPWLVLPEGCDASLPSCESEAAYTAHLGANSGGANGVYWIELLDADADGARIRNVLERAKRRCPTVECMVEPDLVYPLLRWSDVRRYAAAPRGHLLMVQDPASRLGLAESMMRERYPRTLAYFERFRDLLHSRAAYRRYQQRGPFYSMYNVGPYTVAPIKVVWRRMDRQINAAVVESIDDPRLGRRPVVPQETCVLVACQSSDEAHFLCACLNSASIGRRALACSVRGGKGFGTPGLLKLLPLPPFRPDDPRHRALAAWSRQAHAGQASAAQPPIDRLVADLLGGSF
ncbi:MAG: SAM-dependent methyltransferase [Planctomycetaceae bacterium]|nr:SAM-dependent methyltransferase [Planctomycetaceae bacterium]